MPRGRDPWAWLIPLPPPIPCRPPSGVFMNRRDFLAAIPTATVASQLLAEQEIPSAKIAVGPNDWPWWRGPNRDGIAPAQKIPLEWSATKNILWEAAVPGRGHGAATVVGDRVFLATADEKAE